MVKITAYNDELPLSLSGAGGIIISNNTRTSLGSNTPKIESGSGSPGSGPQAAAWDHVHPEFGGGGTVSFGSNSTRVASTSAAGASSSNSRADHVHDGIGTVTASGSNTLNRGTLNLRAGTGISLSLTNTDGGSGLDTVTINSLASGGGGGGGVTSIAKAGSSALTGAVTLTGGTNVTLTQTGNDISIAASGGGGGATIKRAPLKAGTLHATYGDDFDASSLDAKWVAHSTSGSFTTSHVQTQEEDGSWLSMMFSAQNGRIYEPTTDVDQEVICNMRAYYRLSGASQAQGKVGIAILDSSMNGVGMICYNDNTAYLMEITAGVLGANNAVHTSGGINLIANSPVWLRLTRVGNTFTGYISFSGRSWTENTATPTRSKTITASRIAIGSFNDGGNLLTGRLLYEFVDRL